MEKEVERLKDLREVDFKEAVVLFHPDSFTETYSETERSYRISSSEKYFDPTAIGNSLYGTCLDGSEHIRLDYYLFDAEPRWTTERIYVTEEEEKDDELDI